MVARASDGRAERHRCIRTRLMNSAVSAACAGGLQAPHRSLPVGQSSVASPHAIDTHVITTTTANVSTPCGVRDCGRSRRDGSAARGSHPARSSAVSAAVSMCGGLFRLVMRDKKAANCGAALACTGHTRHFDAALSRADETFLEAVLRQRWPDRVGTKLVLPAIRRRRR